MIRVRTPDGDAELAETLARAVEDELRERGFRVPPFRAVRPRVVRFGEDLLGSSVALRQLARKLRVGRLVHLTVLEHRVESARRSGYALPTWWETEELGAEFAEVHLRMQIFDDLDGKVVLDRQDRQHRMIPPAPEGGASNRTAVLDDALGTCLDHLLIGVQAGHVIPAMAPNALGSRTATRPGT